MEMALGYLESAVCNGLRISDFLIANHCLLQVEQKPFAYCYLWHHVSRRQSMALCYGKYVRHGIAPPV